MNSKSSFYNLDPEKVLQAAENEGFLTTGEFSQLNSYENRVFDIRLEKTFENPTSIAENIIAKFYRPNRWSKDAILEEHLFLQDLQAEHIPAVAPLLLQSGSTISEQYGMFATFFPKVRGRMPQEFVGEELVQIGRLMAQVHNIGALRKTIHRPILDTSYYGSWETLDNLQSWIAPEVRGRYNEAAEMILNQLDDLLDPSEFIRIHGDCHKGNLLHNGSQFFLVDFDDFCTGPVIQDFWMLLSGEGEEGEHERNEIIKGYEELREFPDHQWEWVPWLRGLRIISYAGWIAKRWEDPSFPRLFPEFNTFRYWAEEVEALEKIAWANHQ
jgi:Ser/Thr protein kinase RdoA (MazF antagonist)